jgi:hypothetical protein
MHDPFRRPRVFQARRQPIGDPEPLLDLPQAHNAGIGGQSAAVETGDHGLAGDR